MHIGQQIQVFMKSRGISVSWLAKEICCTRYNVYKIFGKASIDTEVLSRICRALHHDFFKDLSDSLGKTDID